jgi:hypothetical protein
MRSGPRETRRNGKTDARCGAGDHGFLAAKIYIHWEEAPVATQTAANAQPYE